MYLKAKLKSRSGASIVVALLLLMVATLACSSLFTVITATVSNAGQGRDREQAMILAQSLSEVVRDEIAKAPEGEPEEGPNYSNIGAYLYHFFGNQPNTVANWAYYQKKGGSFGSLSNSLRTFHLAEQTVRGQTDDLKMSASVSMYWTSDGDTESGLENYTSGRNLYVTVTVTVAGSVGNESASVTTVYGYQNIGTDFWWVYQGVESSTSGTGGEDS